MFGTTPRRNRSRRYLLMYIMLLPILLLVICCGAQFGVMSATFRTFGEGIAPLETADYAPWQQLRFGAVREEAITQAVQERAAAAQVYYSTRIVPTSAAVAAAGNDALADEGTNEASVLGTSSPQAIAVAPTASDDSPATDDTEETGEATTSEEPSADEVDSGETEEPAEEQPTEEAQAAEPAVTNTLPEDTQNLLTEIAQAETTLTAIAQATNTPPQVSSATSAPPTATATASTGASEPINPIASLNLPVAAFQAFESQGTVSFINQSTGNITSYQWRFGDGNGSETASPTHTYTSSGNYTATLTVSGPGGSDSASVIITVLPAPTNTPEPPTEEEEEETESEPVAVAPPQPVSLGLSLTASNSTIAEGETTVLTLSVSNGGGSTATNLNIGLSVPSGLITGVATTTTGTYSGAVWTIDSLAVGGSVQLTLPVRAATGTAGTDLTSVATVVSISPSNNGQSTASDTITVVPNIEADLALTQALSNDVPNENDTIRYDIVVQNNGPNDANNVVVSDTLPAGISLDSSSATVGSFAGNSWTIGTLSVGATATLQLFATVDAGTSGQVLVNVASINADEPDPNTANNSAATSLTVQNPASADLHIDIAVDNATPPEGETINFLVTLTNNGPVTTNSIVVDAALSTGFTLVSSMGDGTYTSGTWTLASLDASTSATINIRAIVDGGTGGSTLTQPVSITSADRPDPMGDNDSATTMVMVQVPVDIQVTTNADAMVAEGEVNETLVSVTNLGAVAVDNVQVQVGYPIAITDNGSDDPAVWSAPVADFGTLAPTQTKTLRLFTYPTNGFSGTDQTITLSLISSNPSDDVPANDIATRTLTVTPGLADLEIVSWTTDNPTPNVGEPYTFTLVVRNNGPSNTSAAVRGGLGDPGLDFDGETPDAGSFTSGSQWVIPDFQAGTTHTLLLFGTVRPGFEGQTIVRNREFVSSTYPDPDSTPNNNVTTEDDYGEVTMNVQPAAGADLELTQMTSTSAVDVGQTFNYVYTIRNNGPDPATNITLVNALPPEVEFVSSGECAATGQDVTCTLSGTLTVGNTFNATINARAIGAGDPVTNVGTVSASETDPDTANNVASADITINALPTADLDFSTYTFDNLNPIPGEQVTATLSITNNGPDVATNIRLSRSMGSGNLGDIDMVTLTHGTSTGLNGAQQWNIPSLNSGETATMTVVLTVTAPVGTTITRWREIIASDQADPDSTPGNGDPAEDDYGTYTVVVAALADLRLVSLCSVDPLLERNWRVDNSNLVDVDYTWDWFGNATTGSGTVPETGNDTFSSPGSPSGSYTVRLFVDGVQNDVAASSGQICDVDLGIAIAADDTVPDEGQTVTYTVTLTNVDTRDATQIEVTSLVPTGLTYGSSVPSQGMYDDATGVWDVGTLASGSTATLDIVATVDTGTSGNTITSTAAITNALQPDANTDNNTATIDVIPVVALGDINIGPPDNLYALVSCGTEVTVDLGSTPITPGDGYDFVFYDRDAGSFVNFERRTIAIAEDPAGPFTEVFNWGDGVLDVNTSLGAAGWGGATGLGAGEGYTLIPATAPPMVGENPTVSGVAIDIDALGLTGSYRYFRMQVPPCLNQEAELDAIEILA